MSYRHSDRTDYESPGEIDRPWDEDAPLGGSGAPVRSDATCTFAWVRGPHQAIEVFVDPVLADRTDQLCSVAQDWAGTAQDLDSLTDAVMRYAAEESLSASVYDDLADDPSTGVVAIALTVG